MIYTCENDLCYLIINMVVMKTTRPEIYLKGYFFILNPRSKTINDQFIVEWF